MPINKTTKNIIGSSAMIGVGSMALEGMGQGSLIPSTTGKAGRMMGAVVPAAYGMEVLNMLKTKKRRRR